MTKKNVAALMLAGAMMTVGSGAMAAKDLGETGNVGIEVSATADDIVLVTIDWGWGADGTETTTPSFTYEWNTETQRWNPKTGSEGENKLTFKATNKSSQEKNVSIERDASDAVKDWLDTTKATIENKPIAISATTEIGIFTVKAKDSLTVKPVTGDLTFNVTIGDVK